jgi:hypothetical protein
MIERRILTAAIGASLLVAGVPAASELPAAAAAAVERLFPAAQIVGVGSEREAGVQYYEVTLREGARETEVEVTPDGAIGEVESVVELASLPAAVQDGIRKSASGARVRTVERHQVHGVARDGTFAPLDPPLTFFEAVVGEGAARREISVAADGSPRPAEAEDGGDDGGDDDD